MIIRCNCKHEAQDRIHGQQMRVHNECRNGQGRCTICETKKTPKIKQTKS